MRRPSRQADDDRDLDDVRPVEHERPLDDERPVDLTPEEEAEIGHQAEPRLPVVFELVRRHGIQELQRPVMSLWWSGVAAGMSIGFSVLAQALLIRYLPEAAWTPLLSSFGYCVGFVLVIMAGQQLFTTNTLTAVAPLLASPSLLTLGLLARLWSVVLLANIAGACLFALFVGKTALLAPELMEQIFAISHHAVEMPATVLVVRGIGAGFLIASLVWILAREEESHFLVIVLITYLVSLGGFAHVVAGSVEAAFLVFDGRISAQQALGGFVAPALAGNVIGGTVLFALLAYAQIAVEMNAAPKEKPADPPAGAAAQAGGARLAADR